MAGASPQTPTGGLISPPDPLLFRGRGGGEEGRKGEGRRGESKGGEGIEWRGNLCSCKFSLKYALHPGMPIVDAVAKGHFGRWIAGKRYIP